MCILRVCIAACDHCTANVAALGGRSKPERLCAFCVRALLLVTTALLMLPHWGGRSKPEPLCAFCVCALLFVTTALLMLPHWGAGVNRNACVHFVCVRFACVHRCL